MPSVRPCPFSEKIMEANPGVLSLKVDELLMAGCCFLASFGPPTLVHLKDNFYLEDLKKANFGLKKVTDSDLKVSVRSRAS